MELETALRPGNAPSSGLGNLRRLSGLDRVLVVALAARLAMLMARLRSPGYCRMFRVEFSGRRRMGKDHVSIPNG